MSGGVGARCFATLWLLCLACHLRQRKRDLGLYLTGLPIVPAVCSLHRRFPLPDYTYDVQVATDHPEPIAPVI